MASNKPKQLRLFNGMCGGYIRTSEWTKPPVISAFSQGETLWIEIPETAAALKMAQEAGVPIGEQANTTYRRMKHWIDFTALQPFVEAQCPSFLDKVHQHKEQIPVIELNSLDAGCIKDSSAIDINRSLIGDVGQITAGNYTVGPAAGDNYPTFGGAGGAVAAIGANQTGNLRFLLTGNITETGGATSTHGLAGYIWKITSNNPSYGNPTTGWLIQVNHQNIMFNLQQEGGGTLDVEHLFTRRIAALNNNAWAYAIQTILAAHQINLHDLLVDANVRARVGFYIVDNTPTVHVWNAVCWDTSDIAETSYGFYCGAANANNILANSAFYNHADNGIELVNQVMTVRNTTSYENGNTDFNQIGGATGRHCRSSDASAADANWAAGSIQNSTNAAVLTDVQTTVDTAGGFFDIVPEGALDGAGEYNHIAARTAGIRNRAVPGPRGYSVGPAEVAAIPRRLQGKIASHSAIGVF